MACTLRCFLTSVHLLLFAAATHAGEITIEYVPPRNPEHVPIYEVLKQRGALEKVQQLFSPFRLGTNLKLQTVGCEGQSNAWYHARTISVCYEYLADSIRRAPAEPEIARSDAVCGQFFYVFAHEMGHAVFDLLDVPVFGHGEDAADLFAAFVMLQFNKEDAKRLVMGATYTFKQMTVIEDRVVLLKAFANAHGTPEQRLFNLLCMAYGADPETFGELVDRGFLPARRASGCRLEFGEIRYAFRQLLSPHVDMDAARRVLAMEWLPRPAGRFATTSEQDTGGPK